MFMLPAHVGRMDSRERNRGILFRVYNMEPSFVLIHIAVVRALQGTIQHHLYGLSGLSSGQVAGEEGGRDLS